MKGSIIKRLCSLTLSAALLICLLPAGTAKAVEVPEIRGDISATLRLDYAQTLDALRNRDVTAELFCGSTSLGEIKLYEDEATLNDEDIAVSVMHKDTLGGELYSDWVGSITFTAENLPQGTYKIKFSGKGYVGYTTNDIALADYSRHVIVGTGDGLLLGDVNGDKVIDNKDIDAISAVLGSEDEGNITTYDLNGDGEINIVDLTYVNHQQGAEQMAVINSTKLIAPELAFDSVSTNDELRKEKTDIKSGELTDLLKDNGEAVEFRTADTAEDAPITIPVVLGNAKEMQEISIIAPAGEAAPVEGKVIVETVLSNGTAGDTYEVDFNQTTPVGYYAIGEIEGKRVINIDLGTRVAVKKITIKVIKTENDAGYTAIESIQFLRDIVPENPVAPNTEIRNLTAIPGNESVTLTWDTLPNISGYKVTYWKANKESDGKKEIRIDKNSAVVTGLENLTTYQFTVTPTDGAWSGKASEPVGATPMPVKPPAKPDMVTITNGDGQITVSWKKGKIATYYKVFYSTDQNGGFAQYGDELQSTSTTITGLINGRKYYVYVIAGNAKGESDRSNIAEGAPVEVEYTRPEGIPTAGIIDYNNIAKVWLKDSGNYSHKEHPDGFTTADMAGMADGNYKTYWTSQSYGDGNFGRSKTVLCDFKEPVDLSSVVWVPRLDGGYRNNLRVYTVTVWCEGDNLSGAGRLVAPDPTKGGLGNNTNTWLSVKNNPSVTKFAILPFEPTTNITRIAITIEQRAYTPVSLSELMFMEYDPAHCLPDEIDALFKNDAHTELAEGVTQAQIDKLKERLNGNEKEYYLNIKTLADELTLAEALLAGNYKGTIINGIQSRSNKHDSTNFGQSGSELQPLGVAAKAKSEITIYAQGIPAGESVTVYASQYNAEVSAWLKSVGTLENGRNTIVVPKIGSNADSISGGSLYVTYSGNSGAAITLHVRRATDIPVLELSDWYNMEEAERKAVIGAYIEELGAYAGGITTATSDPLNVTEISTPVVLLSLPADAAWKGLGSGTNDSKINQLVNSVLAWEDLLHICKTTQGIEGTYADNKMQSRQNIRCMKMFEGAFMYAAGSHIGIGYGSCAGMVGGKPIAQLASDATANNLFGWGIAHEIGHNMDKLGKAEITNNIYAIMAQTYDGENNVLRSRLEKSNKYNAVFNKTAQGYPGASGDVFVQLGMYWQLHLAYDGAKGDDHGPMWFYNEFFKAWKSGKYYSSGDSYDNKVALTASGVAGKDLTEFFTRWGMVLSESTKDTLATYSRESRAIWYLDDAGRRERLANGSDVVASGSLEATAVKKEGSNNKIELTFSGVEGKVQGYEIRRNGEPIAFTKSAAYTDVIGSANHRTYTYKVVAYDILGNEIDSATTGEVRIAYDMTVSPESISRDAESGAVIVTFSREIPVTGFKLVGVQPEEGKYTVEVTKAETDSEGKPIVKTVRNGDFADGSQSDDDENSFVAYFNNPDASENDTSIWTYYAEKIVINGIPENVSVENIQIISYAGDDIALWKDVASVGCLAEDYTYQTLDGTETIKAGSIVVVGTFRGDPVYNTIQIQGRNSDGTGERPLNGDVLLFASVPTEYNISDISDGIFIFVVDEKGESSFQDNEEGDAQDGKVTNILPSQIRAELCRTDIPDSADSKRITAQTIWVSAPGGAAEDLPLVVITGGNTDEA